METKNLDCMSNEMENQGQGEILSNELKVDNSVQKLNQKSDAVPLLPLCNDEEGIPVVQKGNTEAEKKTDI